MQLDMLEEPLLPAVPSTLSLSHNLQEDSLDEPSTLPAALKKFLLSLGLTKQELEDAGIDTETLAQQLDRKWWQWYKSCSCAWYTSGCDALPIKLLMLPCLTQDHLKLIVNTKISVSRLPKWPSGQGLLVESRLGLIQAYMATEFVEGAKFAANLGAFVLVNGFALYFFASLKECERRHLYWSLNGIPRALSKIVSPVELLSTLLSTFRSIGINYLTGELGSFISKKTIRLLTFEQSPGSIPYLLSIGIPWALMLGIPTVWGGLNALLGAFNSKPLPKVEIQALLATLKQHVPHWFKDTLLSLSPFSKLQRALKQIERALVWDGRLTSQERSHLLEALRHTARQGQSLTQLTALTILAKVAAGLAWPDFNKLKAAGYDNTNLVSLLRTKLKALAELRLLADYYQPPGQAYFILRPLLRYSYANYLLWTIGEPSLRLLHPAFYSFEAIKLSYKLFIFTISLWFTTVTVWDSIELRRCQQAKGRWNKWLRHEPEFLSGGCLTTCPELPLVYTNLNQDCLDEYLKTPNLTKEQILEIINRFPANGKSWRKNNNGYFHNQNLDNHDVIEILEHMSKRNITHPMWENLNFTYSLSAYQRPLTPFSALDNQRLAASLHNLKLQQLSLAGRNITDATWIELLKALVGTPIKRLDVKGHQLTSTGINMLLTYFPSRLETLDISQANNKNVTAFELPLDKFILKDNLELYLPTPIAQISLDNMAESLKYSNNTHYIDLLSFSGQAKLNFNFLFEGLGSGFSGIKRLDLSHSQLHSQNLTLLSQVLEKKKIRDELNLADNNLTGTDIIDLVSNLSKVTCFQEIPTIDVSNNAISEQGLVTLMKTLFTRPQNCSDDVHTDFGNNLRLNLSNSNVTSSMLKSLFTIFENYLKNYLYLELDLSHNVLDDESLKQFRPRGERLLLKQINLANTSMTKEGVVYLKQNLADYYTNTSYPGFMRQLEIIDLSNNLYGDAVELIDIISAPIMTQWNALTFTLRNNGINDTGFTYLADLLIKASAAQIKVFMNTFTSYRLDLSGNLITNPADSRLFYFPDRGDYREYCNDIKITYLDLSFNNISTENAIKLCNMYAASGLSGINLAGNPIDTSILDPYTCRMLKPEYMQTSAASRLAMPWPYRLVSSGLQWLWMTMPGQLLTAKSQSTGRSQQPEEDRFIAPGIVAGALPLRVESAPKPLFANALQTASTYLGLFWLGAEVCREVYRWYSGEARRDYQAHKAWEKETEAEFKALQQQYAKHPYGKIYFQLIREPDLITEQELVAGMASLSEEELKQLAKLAEVTEAEREDILQDLPDCLQTGLNWLAVEAKDYLQEHPIMELQVENAYASYAVPLARHSFWSKPALLPQENLPVLEQTEVYRGNPYDLNLD